MRRNARKAGLTLIEVLIGSVILAAVMAVTMNILFTSSRQVERASIAQNLEQRGRQIIGTLGGDFVTGRFKLDTANLITALRSQNPYNVSGVGASAELGIFANNTEIRYMVGGDQDASGLNGKGSPVPPGFAAGTRSATIKSGQMAWGAVLPTNGGPNPFRKDLAYFVRFEAHTVLLESSSSTGVGAQPASWGAPFPALPTLTTVNANMNIDKDSSSSDTFVLGKLRRYVVAPVGHPALPAGGILAREELDDNVILKVASAGVWNGNMDPGVAGSGILFQFIDKTGAQAMAGGNPTAAATAVQITVWHGNFDEMRKDFWLRKNTATVHFRNPQT